MSRVLVVDDCPDTVATFSRLLHHWGHDVYSALDGRSALALAAALDLDAALIDLRMPNMDGVELARRLRQLPGLRRAVLVAVTGSSNSTRGPIPDGTFDFLLRKPVDPAELRRLLAGLAVPPPPPALPKRPPLPASDSSWQLICVGG